MKNLLIMCNRISELYAISNMVRYPQLVIWKSQLLKLYLVKYLFKVSNKALICLGGTIDKKSILVFFMNIAVSASIAEKAISLQSGSNAKRNPK